MIGWRDQCLEILSLHLWITRYNTIHSLRNPVREGRAVKPRLLITTGEKTTTDHQVTGMVQEERVAAGLNHGKSH